MEQPQLQQLFVYGSLRQGFRHPAYAYISRYFTLVSEGKVKANLYDMGEYPAAIPDETSGRTLVGELYRINHPDELGWALAQLDDYEGLNTENQEPGLFRREPVTVYANGQTCQAWVYWFNGDTSGKPFVESGDVLQYLHEKNK